jgi:hypothetical protein
VQEIMTDPVLVPETGMSYERRNIEEWLNNNMFVKPSITSILD